MKSQKKQPSLMIWKLTFLFAGCVIMFGLWQMFIVAGIVIGDIQPAPGQWRGPTYDTATLTLVLGFGLAIMSRVFLFLLS